MKRDKMYVEGIYEIPEVRSVTPGHLVRCGRSSPYDVNFGKEAGAAAVLLLMQGIAGVTIADVKGKKIRYMKTTEAIKQRFVDLDQVAVHEQMGTCFGRVPQAFKPVMEELTVAPERHL